MRTNKNARIESIGSILERTRINKFDLNILSEEEQLKKTFSENGYDARKISIFFHYLNKKIPPERYHIYKELITNMLYFLKTKGLLSIVERLERKK